MADLDGFDANTVEPGGFDLLPAGRYDVVITDSKLKPTKNGAGKYLELKLQVLSGPYQNRVLFDRLNLENPSQQAVAISRGTLSAICRAVGVMTPKDSSELHNRPLSCSVKVQDEFNVVGSYKPRTQQTQQPSDAATVAAGSDSPPWG